MVNHPINIPLYIDQNQYIGHSLHRLQNQFIIINLQENYIARVMNGIEKTWLKCGSRGVHTFKVN